MALVFLVVCSSFREDYRSLVRVIMHSWLELCHILPSRSRRTPLALLQIRLVAVRFQFVELFFGSSRPRIVRVLCQELLILLDRFLPFAGCL